MHQRLQLLKACLLLILCLLSLTAGAQVRLRVHGRVVDGVTNKPSPNVFIYLRVIVAIIEPSTLRLGLHPICEFPNALCFRSGLC